MQPRRRHRPLLELGRGGMGTVYLALNDRDELVVLKRLRDDLAADPELLAMFVDEARLSARLHHPNVVRTIDVGTDGAFHHIEMEYLEGHSLHAVARAAAPTGGIPIAIAAGVVMQVLDGLHHAHELRGEDGAALDVVHRDVSPHNVFVTYDGTVKLLDFGIAKAADSSHQTYTDVVKGKAGYMSPEQARRVRATRRSDLFSIGVVLWELIANARFWGELGANEILARLQVGDAKAGDGRREIPPGLAAICDRAMSVATDDRYETAAQMRDALHAWIADAKLEENALPAAVGAFMSELFAKRRAAMADEVAYQLENARAMTIRTRDGTLPPRAEDDAGTSRGRAWERWQERAPRRRLAGFALAALVAGGAGVALYVRGVQSSAAPSSVVPSASVGAVARCAHAAACSAANGGRPYVCRQDDGACVALESDDCTVRADARALASDDTLWIGAMFPLTGPDAQSYGLASAQAVDLARRDFTQLAGGIPSKNADHPVRPIGLVTCDDAVDPSRVARHLADDVRVPAVIGFHSSKEVVDLASSIFIPRRVLSLASLNGAAIVTRVPHPDGVPRLVWRTAVSTAQTATAVAALIGGVLEPRLRKSTLGAGEPTRIALVNASTTTGITFSDTLFATLRFNDAGVLENGDRYRHFVYGDPTGNEGALDYGKVVEGILAFRPHVVVHVGNDDDFAAIREPVEARWEGAANGSMTARPYYVTNGVWEGERFFTFIGRSAERRRRFFGLTPPRTTAPNVKFTMHYNETFPDQVTNAFAPAPQYDAFYVVAFAAYAAGERAITGEQLASAIPRIVGGGQHVDVGPAHIFDAFDALRRGDTIDLEGASSTLNFDIATGDRRSDIAVLCVGMDAQGRAHDNVESGLVYVAASGVFRGELRCP